MNPWQPWALALALACSPAIAQAASSPPIGGLSRQGISAKLRARSRAALSALLPRPAQRVWAEGEHPTLDPSTTSALLGLGYRAYRDDGPRERLEAALSYGLDQARHDAPTTAAGRRTAARVLARALDALAKAARSGYRLDSNLESAVKRGLVGLNGAKLVPYLSAFRIDVNGHLVDVLRSLPQYAGGRWDSRIRPGLFSFHWKRAMNARLATFDALLRAGADANDSGATPNPHHPDPPPLVFAAGFRNPELAERFVRALVKRGAVLDARYDARNTDLGKTALDTARRRGHAAVEQLLLRAGAVDSDLQTEDRLVEASSPEEARRLLASAKGPIHAPTVWTMWNESSSRDHSAAPLAAAGVSAAGTVSQGRLRGLGFPHAVIAHQQRLWSKEPHDQRPLVAGTFAAMRSAGADLEARDPEGRTPLLRLLQDTAAFMETADWRRNAHERQLLSVLDDLIAARVDVNAKLSNGQSALDLAHSEDYPLPASVAEHLEKAGAQRSAIW